jgi:hypothetical protein
MKTLLNLPELQERISNANQDRAGYICLGYGSNDNPFGSYYNIDWNDLWATGMDGFRKSFAGNSPNYRYYVTEEFYNTNIKPETPMTPTELYLKQSDGSTVRVIAKAGDKERGWKNNWPRGFDKYVGQEVTVIDTLDHNMAFGVRVKFADGNTGPLPFFVLYPVSDPIKVPEPIRISSEYEVKFKADASIEVGCQTISYEKLMEIVEAVESVKKQIKN